MKHLLYLLFFVVISCTEAEKVGMLDRQPQSETSRQIVHLDVVEKVNLWEIYELPRLYQIRVDSSYIYLSNTYENNVLQIDKRDYNNYRIIGEGTGQGPRELANIQGFDITGNEIVMMDRINRKLLYYTNSGEFISEHLFDSDIRPHRVSLMEESVLIASPMTSDYVFSQFDRDGNIINKFEEPDFNGTAPYVDGVLSMLIYEGYITNDGDNFFYAGFSESVIRKYSQSGEVIYSMNTIDHDYNNLWNYSSHDDRQQVMQHTAIASFSSAGMVLWDDYIAVIKYDNLYQRHSKKLDIYTKDEGKYLKTIKLTIGPVDIAIDDDFIYLIRFIEGEPYLVKYENIIGHD